MGEETIDRLDEATRKLMENAESAFDALCQRFAHCFFRQELRDRFRRYLLGLFRPLPRRNAWQLSEEIGDRTPYGTQDFVRRASWSADELREGLRDYVVDELQAPDGVLIVDETGFLKKGTASVGVKRQYSGTAGKVENCQVGVFLGYASGKGAAFLDRDLYLPKEWADDLPRRQTAGVPAAVTFATKPELARRMLGRAFEGGVVARWVTADEAYGSDGAFRSALEDRQQAYVLAVRSNEVVWRNRGHGPAQETVAEVAESVSARAWKRLSAGAGAKGPRWYDWAWVPLVGDGDLRSDPAWEPGLLVRRSLKDRTDLAFYRVLAPAEATLQEIVSVAGRRWGIEELLESAKQEVGLDEYEVRTWTAWYRYITLAMVAHAFLSVLRAQVNPPVAWGPPSEPDAGTVRARSEKGGSVSVRSSGVEARATRRPGAVIGSRDPSITQHNHLGASSPLGSPPFVVLLAATPSSPSSVLPLSTASTS
jgi:SRSO17 transposase